MKMSYSFVVNLCCSSLKQKMGDYGEYLLCPVCKELITHPVLLPCQHNVCYGCARSQILAADAEENTICEETPSTPSRNRNNTPAAHQVKHRRRLESTPSESSVLSYASSKRDSGIETSPTHGSSLTKGFSFVSTASSICSSGSNDTCQHHDHDDADGEMKNGDFNEKNGSATKNRSKTSTKGRRIMPKFHSSPRLSASNSRSGTSRSPGTIANGDTDSQARATHSPGPPALCVHDPSDMESTQLNGICSPVVFKTDDLVHFQTSGLEAGKQAPANGIEGGNAREQSHCNHYDTPKTTGLRPRKKSAAKPPRRNSKLNGTLSSAELEKSILNSSSSPSSISSSASKAAKGMRRANSTSTISRSPSLRATQRGADVIKRSKVKSIYCLTCEADVELGKLGIKGLFRNFQLEGIVERFRAKAKAKVAIRCGYCKPPASDATKSCLDCKLSYCNQCYKTVHVWGTKKAQHDFIGPTNNFSRPKVMLCPEHGAEPVNMYCNRCQHSVCRACKSRGGAHANHPIISVKNAYKESKDRLYGLMDVLKNKKESMEGAILELESNIKSFEDEEGMVRDEIHSAIDEMHKLLELKRTHLLEKADRFARRKECEMRKDLQNMKSNAMYSSVMAFAEEVLLENDPAYFLQTIKMVETRVQEAIEHMAKLPAASQEGVEETLPPEMEHSEPRSMLRLYLDLDRPRNSIDQLDFIKAPGAPIFHPDCISGDMCGARSGEWRLEGDSETSNCFQIHYWQDRETGGESFETYDVNGSIFRIPPSSKISEGCGQFSARVRAANRAGFGPWSAAKRVSANFLRRKVFKLINIERSNRLLLEGDGRLALHQNLSDTVAPTFSFLAGDISLEGFLHYFEVCASGSADFHFVVGVAVGEADYRTNGDFAENLEPGRSALLYCGPRDCHAVENGATELQFLLNGKRGGTQVSNSDHQQLGSTKKPASFSPLKPLKQLKNTLLRRSSFNGPLVSVKAKSDKRVPKSEEDQFRRITNGNETTACGLLRSSSVTSLPSVLRAQSPVSDQLSRSSSQWNIRSHVGIRCFRIGVEMAPLDNGRIGVQFHDISGPEHFVLSSTFIDANAPFYPLLAMSGDGQIAVV